MPQLYLSLKPTRALRICAAFLLVTLLGCGDASDGSIPNASAQRGFTTMDAGGGALESIELPSLIALWKSQDYTFEPVFTPTDALDKSVVWDSSDASVVAIEQNGTITAKAIGYANITATSATNNAIQASVIVSVDREVARVVSGGNHTVILDSKGEVWVAGRNDCGQLGLGNRDNNSTFVKVKDLQSGVVSVAAGWEHTLAIDSKGDIWAVGCNDYGQLGSGDLNPRDSFERITDKGDIVSVAAGAYHSIALDDKGAIWTTGKNDSGQLGIGSGDSALFAQIPTVSSVTHIAAGNENTLAIDSASQAWIAGDNTYGQLGLGDENPVTLFSRISYIPNIANAAFSAKSAYLLDANGNVWASGYNGVGELGTGSVQYTENIFSIALSAFAFDAYAGYPYALENIVDISAGRDRVLAVDSEGYLWTTKPRDDYFFLIDPDSDYYFKIMCDYYAHGYPVGFCNIKRTFDKVLNVSGVKRVAAGDFYALTLDENGSLWASGVNAYGQLGFGDAEFRFGFAKVPLPLLVICPEGQYLDEITNTCKSLATSIYFVNGVHNTEDDATFSKNKLEKTHGERLRNRYEQELFEFKLSYNYHYGDVADLQEMFWQKFKEKEYDEDFYANYFVAWLRALYVAFVSDDALWLIAQEVIDAFSAQPNILIAEQDNLNEMIGAYLDDIAEHKRLLLVAHSQGNLYANQSIRFLRDTFGEEGSKYIKMIGVASPAAVTSDPYITACDDVIINSLRLSPYYSVLACNINNKPQGEDFRNFISHSFVDDYLDMRLPSGEAIKSLIDNIVGQWDHPATQ